MTDQSVLVLCGSLRSESLNRMLCNTLPTVAPAGMRFTDAPDIGSIPLYNADLQEGDGFPDAVIALADAIRAADAVMIVSPEYNYSVPGVLKNAIDWVSRVPDQPFAGKPVALQSAAVGALGGARCQYHLRQIMVFLDAVLFNKPEVFVSFAKTKVDGEKGVVSDDATLKVMASQLEGFAAFINRLG